MRTERQERQESVEDLTKRMEKEYKIISGINYFKDTDALQEWIRGGGYEDIFILDDIYYELNYYDIGGELITFTDHTERHTIRLHTRDRYETMEDAEVEYNYW